MPKKATNKFVMIGTEGDDPLTITVKEAKETTVIETPAGPATITVGNFIATNDNDQTQFGITPGDLKVHYKPVEK